MADKGSNLFHEYAARWYIRLFRKKSTLLFSKGTVKYTYLALYQIHRGCHLPSYHIYSLELKMFFQVLMSKGDTTA